MISAKMRQYAEVVVTASRTRGLLPTRPRDNSLRSGFGRQCSCRAAPILSTGSGDGRQSHVRHGPSDVEAVALDHADDPWLRWAPPMDGGPSDDFRTVGIRLDGRPSGLTCSTHVGEP